MINEYQFGASGVKITVIGKLYVNIRNVNRKKRNIHAMAYLGIEFFWYPGLIK